MLPASAPPIYLFVYGTLRRNADFPTHDLILPATFVCPGTFPGKLYDVGNYPGAILSEDSNALVHGEIYLLHAPEVTLKRLDAYEGCTPSDPTPTEYVRQSLSVTGTGGEIFQAQVYLYNRAVEHLTRVPSGDYLQWRSR